MTAFATPAQMMLKYDIRTLGDICSDDDDTRISEANLPTNDILLDALNSATGKVKATTLRAGRYTTAQLEALTGESADYLADLTCQIAWYRLWKRKPYVDDQRVKDAKEEYEEALKELRSGDEIFDIAAVIDAGHPTVNTVTRVEIERDWDLFVDQARGHFYPRRRSYQQR